MISKPGKEIPALYGGIIIGIITSNPVFNALNYCCCCGGIIVGGIFAVKFYKDHFTPETPVFTSSDCLVVGGLAGLVGAAIGTALGSIFLALFGHRLAQLALDYLTQSQSQMAGQFGGTIQGIIDGEREAIQKFIDEGYSPFMFIISLVQNFVLDIVFGGIGGLLGYQIFKPKPFRNMMPPVQPPGLR
jgi:hypothetical protein